MKILLRRSAREFRDAQAPFHIEGDLSPRPSRTPNAHRHDQQARGARHPGGHPSHHRLGRRTESGYAFRADGRVQILRPASTFAASISHGTAWPGAGPAKGLVGAGGAAGQPVARREREGLVVPLEHHQPAGIAEPRRPAPRPMPTIGCQPTSGRRPRLAPQGSCHQLPAQAVTDHRNIAVPWPVQDQGSARRSDGGSSLALIAPPRIASPDSPPARGRKVLSHGLGAAGVRRDAVALQPGWPGTPARR